MKRALVLCLLLAGCAAPQPEFGALWLPAPETMAKIQYLDFHNDGPAVAILKAAAPNAIQGAEMVGAGKTVRVMWRNNVYSTEILP